MSVTTMILGESGTGKTTSLRTLNPAQSPSRCRFVTRTGRDFTHKTIATAIFFRPTRQAKLLT